MTSKKIMSVTVFYKEDCANNDSDSCNEEIFKSHPKYSQCRTGDVFYTGSLRYLNFRYGDKYISSCLFVLIEEQTVNLISPDKIDELYCVPQILSLSKKSPHNLTSWFIAINSSHIYIDLSEGSFINSSGKVCSEKDMLWLSCIKVNGHFQDGIYKHFVYKRKAYPIFLTFDLGAVQANNITISKIMKAISRPVLCTIQTSCDESTIVVCDVMQALKRLDK